MSDNYFLKLNAVDVNKHTKKKAGLTYLSWAWAWTEVKRLHPDATYAIYDNADGWNYHTDGRTCWVKTGVTVNGIEHIEELPVLDHRNKSVPLDKVTSYDVNKAIQRSLTKACARHGLGLYVYAGEDLPDDGIKRLGDEANAIYKRFIGSGNDGMHVKECMRKAAMAFEADNPRDVPMEHKQSYLELVSQLLLGHDNPQPSEVE